jgi:hypothetical protein
MTNDVFADIVILMSHVSCLVLQNRIQNLSYILILRENVRRLTIVSLIVTLRLLAGVTFMRSSLFILLWIGGILKNMCKASTPLLLLPLSAKIHISEYETSDSSTTLD